MLIKKIQGEHSLLALYDFHPSRYPFLLESVTRSATSRYSILFAFPQDEIVSHFDEKQFFTSKFDDAFDNLSKGKPDSDLNLPFRGGWFVYLGYELAGQLETTLNLYPDTFSLPLAKAIRIPAAIIVDHVCKETWLVVEPTFPAIFAQLKKDFVQACKQPFSHEISPLKIKMSDSGEEAYLRGVSRIREYIAAGDVFQVNYSREWDGVLVDEQSNLDLYQALRQKNPAPFAALCNFGSWSIISSSPERLVKIKNSQIETRPIAGTRPRSFNPESDQRLLEELIAHPKERAEHVMLIDLERNDLGRLCEAGSVVVDEFMAIESYQHVHHIVSNVKGHLLPNITPGQIIRAVFPGGTITGCPKVRCMEIIAELEQVGRGAYTGSVGYINHNGDMDMNILIRTMTKKDNRVVFRTGAGIVYDSVPEFELRETRYKAQGLLNVFS